MIQVILALLLAFAMPAHAADKTEKELFQEIYEEGFTSKVLDFDTVFSMLKEGESKEAYFALSYLPMTLNLTTRLIDFMDAELTNTKVQHARLLEAIHARRAFVNEANETKVKALYIALPFGEASLLALRILNQSEKEQTHEFAQAELWKLSLQAGVLPIIHVLATGDLLKSAEYHDQAFGRIQELLKNPTYQKTIFVYLDSYFKNHMTKPELDFFMMLDPKKFTKEAADYLKMFKRMNKDCEAGFLNPNPTDDVGN